MTEVAGYASRTFSYQCGSKAVMSAVFNFTTAPAKGGDVSAIVWADMGAFSSQATKKEMLTPKN